MLLVAKIWAVTPWGGAAKGLSWIKEAVIKLGVMLGMLKAADLMWGDAETTLEELNTELDEHNRQVQEGAAANAAMTSSVKNLVKEITDVVQQLRLWDSAARALNQDYTSNFSIDASFKQLL